MATKHPNSMDSRRSLSARRRTAVLVFLAALLPVSLFCPSAPLIAQARSTAATIDGFGVSYAAPSGWTLSGREGRIHAWANATQSAALVIYAGHFSPLELALGDAQRVLGVPRDEDTRIITPLTPTSFGSRTGMSGSLRIVGARSVVAHVAVVQLDDSTVLGAVAVLDSATQDAVLAAASREVTQLLTNASLRSGEKDTTLAARLSGVWAANVAYTSSPTGGGYTNDESWSFRADGAFAYKKRFAVSMPGAAVTPEERNDQGRWYTIGGALVLISEEGRMTVDVQFAGGKLVLDGTTFTKQ